jgi:hypothetical protein
MKINRGIGGHTKPGRGATNDWITPKYIIDALGPFDLDPCECLQQPWPCAREAYNVNHDGLKMPWFDRCWVNPPYGEEAWPFLERLASHRNGIGLIFGRTETKLFNAHVWQQADAILFLAGRLTFFKPDGQKGGGNSGGPSVLIAYGENNIEALRTCGLPGALVIKWELQNARAPG